MGGMTETMTKGAYVRVLDTPQIADDYPGLAGTVVVFTGSFVDNELGCVADGDRPVWLFPDEVEPVAWPDIDPAGRYITR